MSNSPQQFLGLRYVKECNLVEAWHEYVDERYIFLRDFNGVWCRVLLDEDFNYETDEFDIMIDSRSDLGYNIDVRVHVYEDVLLKVRNVLQDIESALRSASNMDVQTNGIVATLEQDRDKRSHLERAEQKGYSAMQAIDAFKQNELEELLGVENGRKLFYTASAVRSRTYQALDGSQSIDDVRMFINELLTLVELPAFPTPPPAPKARYAVYNNNLFGHLIVKRGVENVTDECIIGRFDSPGAAMKCALKVSNDTSDTIVVYDCYEREWLAAIEPSPDSDDFVEYDTDDDGDSELLHWNGNDLVPVGMGVSPIVERADEVLAKDATIAELGENLDLIIQERDALNARLKDLHNIGAEFEQFRTRYAEERDEWKTERRNLIKDAFDAKYSLSLAEIELNKVKKDRDNLQGERDTARANYTMLEGEHEKLSDVFDQMQQERDDWKLRCESAKLELMESKRRADDARQETLRWKDAYAASEESNKKLFYQRHKLAKQLVRRRNPRVVTLLK